MQYITWKVYHKFTNQNQVFKIFTIKDIFCPFEQDNDKPHISKEQKKGICTYSHTVSLGSVIVNSEVSYVGKSLEC